MKPLSEVEADRALNLIAAWLNHFHPTCKTALLVVEDDQDDLHVYPMVNVIGGEEEGAAAKRLATVVLLKLDESDFVAGGTTGSKERAQ